MKYVDKLLADAQIPGDETYWVEQPVQTYAAWGDHITTDGSDLGNELIYHDVEIELYELMDHPDQDAHRRLQAALDAEALRWEKEPRMLNLTLRLFMTVYKFTYTERR